MDGSEAAALIAGLDDGRRRALALTVAMLHGAAADTISQASAQLLRRVSHPADERPRLDRSDLTTDLAGIRAGTDLDGRVRFQTAGLDMAVRAHFWTYFPDLRPGFRMWVGDCARDLSLERDDRHHLVERFAEQTLRIDRPEELMSLARDWTSHGESQALLPDATQALAEGLRHEVHGRVVRRRILDWVTEPGLPNGFRTMLTVVCSRVMAVSHSDQALVRLHHLARAESEYERRPAWDALFGLAAGESRLCGLLLRRLTGQRVDSEARPPADAQIFLALADQVCRTAAFLARSTIRERLVTGWSLVLEHRPPQEWAPHVRYWLDAAVDSLSSRDRLLTTLAYAGACQPRSISRLFVISQRWARASATARTERGLVAERFSRALDMAQGIETASTSTLSPPHRRPETAS
ncbi:hypothetical protein [Streptomyces hainanensis]|uniref:Uncharacterized protein n=1 Tax=Streptomyces hainanensis TaxID=402648 RepID=A0A4R4SNL4_9ACTN|nr:hypothetical protein [Streptomyces hainanensis]TDC64174.1 hypothetical protein E1283_31760 [Streptomyces hainanensis]